MVKVLFCFSMFSIEDDCEFSVKFEREISFLPTIGVRVNVGLISCEIEAMSYCPHDDTLHVLCEPKDFPSGEILISHLVKAVNSGWKPFTELFDDYSGDTDEFKRGFTSGDYSIVKIEGDSLTRIAHRFHIRCLESIGVKFRLLHESLDT